MRGRVVARSFALVVAVIFAASQVAAQAPGAAPQTPGAGRNESASAVLRLPVAGATTAGETFTGTLSVHGFVLNGQTIFAMGIISGIARDPNGIVLGTFLNGQVEIEVTACKRGQCPVQPRAGLTPRGGTRAVRGEIRPAIVPGVVLVQQAAPAEVLHLQFGGLMLSALALTFDITPITIDLACDTAGGALGNLVCTALTLLNNLVGLVGVLNQILSVLGSLTGGLTGGFTA